MFCMYYPFSIIKYLYSITSITMILFLLRYRNKLLDFFLHKYCKKRLPTKKIRVCLHKYLRYFEVSESDAFGVSLILIIKLF